MTKRALSDNATELVKGNAGVLQLIQALEEAGSFVRGQCKDLPCSLGDECRWWRGRKPVQVVKHSVVVSFG